jgi:hypothetical protein
LNDVSQTFPIIEVRSHESTAKSHDGPASNTTAENMDQPPNHPKMGTLRPFAFQKKMEFNQELVKI